MVVKSEGEKTCFFEAAGQSCPAMSRGIAGHGFGTAGQVAGQHRGTAGQVAGPRDMSRDTVAGQRDRSRDRGTGEKAAGQPDRGTGFWAQNL